MPGIILELAPVVLQTFVIYIFLIFGLSLLGHRDTAQLGPLEVVIIMVLGSAVETSMVAGDTGLLAGLTCATTLLICNWGITRVLAHWKWLRKILIGQPIVLVYNGKLLSNHMREAGLSQDDIMEGIRERGYDDLGQLRLVVLEADGSISAVPKNNEKVTSIDIGKDRNKPARKK